MSCETEAPLKFLGSDVGEEGLEEARDCGGEQAGVCVCVCSKLDRVSVLHKVGRCSYGIDCGAVAENKQVFSLLALLVQKYLHKKVQPLTPEQAGEI